MHSLLCALLLAAAPGVPFPPPLATPLDENLKFSGGTIVSIDAPSHTMLVKTTAGPVRFDVQQAKVVGPDKQPRTIQDLAVAQQVSIYFHLANGAVVQEIDF
jgi:hypothetical protein